MWLDNASKLDMLFYKPYADLVKEILEDGSYNPLTIGIFGLWGAGKSTLLNMIRDSIEHEDVEVIEINAWMFEGYEDAKTALMESLLKSMENNKKFKDKVGKEIKELLKRVNWLKLGTKAISYAAPLIASVGLANPIPLLVNVASDVASDKAKLSKAISNTANGVQSIRENFLNEKENSTVENIRQFKLEFENMLKKTEIKNLVVLIDDLDRCNPDRIIETLEAIKLFLSVQGTTFVIAADESVIQYAIKKKYPKTNDSEPDISKEYIEKIIQLPIYIPELSGKDIENYLTLLMAQKYLETETFEELLKIIYEERILVNEDKITLSKLNELMEKTSKKIKDEDEYIKDINVIENIKSIVASTLKGNPRQAKRFLNTFITKKKLAECYYGEEIDIRILAKLLVLQKIDNYRFKELNEWNKDFNIKNENLENLVKSYEDGKIAEEYELWNSTQIKKWIECEPKDLYNYRLDKYFYLTRDLLNTYIIDDSNLDGETKHILDDLGKADQYNIDEVINKMSLLAYAQIKNLFDILLPKIKNGKLEFFIINSLFKKFNAYRKEIIIQIKEGENKIELPDVFYIQNMYKLEQTMLEDCIESLKNKKRIEEKTYKMIKGE